MTALREQVESSAAALSRKSGRWLSDRTMEIKDIAVRPVAWVARDNPRLARRAALGDLAASIAAEYRRPGGG